MSILPRLVSAVVLALVSTLAFGASFVSGASDGVAIEGYDPVAYFTEGKPVKGNPRYTADWGGTKWQFDSAEHRDRFQEAPDKYAPQFGGYCAYATSHGGIATGDPQRWRVVGERLYLNNNLFAQQLWLADVPGNIRNGDKNWPTVKAKIEDRQ